MNGGQVTWDFLTGFWQYENAGQTYVSYFHKLPEEGTPSSAGLEDAYLCPASQTRCDSIVPNAGHFYAGQRSLIFKTCGGVCSEYASLDRIDKNEFTVDYSDIAWMPEERRTTIRYKRISKSIRMITESGRPYLERF